MVVGPAEAVAAVVASVWKAAGFQASPVAVAPVPAREVFSPPEASAGLAMVFVGLREDSAACCLDCSAERSVPNPGEATRE